MKAETKQLPKEWKEEKLNEIKRLLPIVWDSYEHMREIRKRGADNFRNFLLIVISFLPLISLSLFNHFDNILFFIPIVFQLVAFLLLIKTYFINEPQVPWINPKDFPNRIDQNKFDIIMFSQLKALEDDTFTQLNKTGKYVTWSLYTLLFSLYTLVLAVFFIYFSSFVLYLLIIFLTELLICIYIFYHKQITYETNKNMIRYLEQIEKWLKE